MATLAVEPFEALAVLKKMKLPMNFATASLQTHVAETASSVRTPSLLKNKTIGLIKGDTDFK